MKHLSLWVAACDKLKIKITADAAEAVVAAYQESQGQGHKNTPSIASNVEGIPAFSLDAFIDALVAFIAVNDQVGFLFTKQASETNIL